METLKFKAIFKTPATDSKVIRIGTDIYGAITYIALRTGLPTTQVANRLLDAALRDSELEGDRDEDNILENYKRTKRKYD